MKTKTTTETIKEFDRFLEGRVAAWRKAVSLTGAGFTGGLPDFLGMDQETYGSWVAGQLTWRQYDRMGRCWKGWQAVLAAEDREGGRSDG